ncbi:ribonuclease E/G [Methyloceanibacter sp.]|uniref:Rne/Rng family ribonuclease n=1 Tax=Methyloceanibacter sp. TaxID=1965321 RepID=UPI002D2E3D5B|nr:ribonuclease E/G [Methyloceanibacter sp.]HZP08014.1 ribonuclease E/G [Methyloceanibacter sp.]
MASKMLIDAAHPEETRVVAVKGNRVEEFDYESASKKQLRGNIYLAKVTRVEPSLQAAFVDYGGNRHGFLAFSEIHPDYYQIPVADRQALLEAEAEEESRASAAEAAEDEAAAGRRRRRGRRGRGRHGGEARRDAERPLAQEAEPVVGLAKFEVEDEIDTTPREDDPAPSVAMEASELVHEVSEPAEPADELDAESTPPMDEKAEGEDAELRTPHGLVEEVEEDDDEVEAAEIVGQPVALKEGNGEAAVEETVESVGSEDALEELPERPRRRRGRPYKIQEVIRRRQIILVQVVKEERGNKGAALTTYLSLAGRYTVLMPNTARGGGISRKITNPTDRKRLREIAGELEVPEGMGLIIRTAGAQRTKTEIKRDYDYLLRLWENVRDLTLKSTAPALVYEEGSLIKRSIRDLYNKDIDEVLVAGDEAYREAKDFMRMLMPSHAKNVKPYKEPEPIFIRYQVERQLAAMFSPQVVLKSGGYIVINQTEALVSIDVNSGKATREHNIEDTALKTNLEAAEEIARQLRLRDLAGLIVIDFIDMDERRNNRLVERRLKEALRHDRARIQVGRISHFGLLEMSRQRLRPGMLEGSTKPCPMCTGTGIVRSVESVALDILRSIEDRLITDGVVPLVATTAVEVALYILNQKRAHLKDIEARYRIPITVTADEDMHVSQFVIERGSEGAMLEGENPVVHMDWAHHRELPAEGAQASAPHAHQPASTGENEGEQRGRRGRRRRRKRHGEVGAEGHRLPQAEREPHERLEAEEDEADLAAEEAKVSEARTSEPGEGGGQQRKGRRRGRRGGRRGRGRQERVGTEAQGQGDWHSASSPAEAPSRPTSREAREERSEAEAPQFKPQIEDHIPREEEAPGRREPKPLFGRATADEEAARESMATPTPEAEPEQAAGPPRRGWWRR